MSEAPIDAVSAVNPVPLESCVPYTRFPHIHAQTYVHTVITHIPQLFICTLSSLRVVSLIYTVAVLWDILTNLLISHGSRN